MTTNSANVVVILATSVASLSFPLQLIKTVWRSRIILFWPVWITITCAVAVFLALVIRKAATPSIMMGANASIIQNPRTVWSRTAIAALMMLIVFLVCYTTVILAWEHFTWADNSMFTLITLRGHDLAPPIVKETGRFFPLGMQEFNLVRHFTDGVAGYYALPIAQFLIMAGLLIIIDDELSISARVALVSCAFITPGSVISFTGLIYEERNVLFFLVCLLLFVRCFEQSQSTAWAVAVVVCAQIMIYYKETAFVLLFGFAVSRLVFRCWKGDRRGWDLERLRDRQSLLDLCLISLAVLFLLYYVSAMLPHMSMQYAHDHTLPLTSIVLAYIRIDLLAWLFSAFVLGRLYLVMRHTMLPSPLWDGVAVGGVMYFAAYIYLRMYSGYYLAPVDMIAVLYLGRFAVLSWGRRNLASRIAIAVACGVILVQDISLSAFRVFERKNIVLGKAEIASVVKAQFETDPGNARRLFFPFASAYVVMEFASYLNYQGVPVEGSPYASAGANSFVLVSRDVVKDGPCVGYETFICHVGKSPDPNDLVIILPDDDASSAEATRYRDGGELLFSYEPRPQIPHWMSPFVGRLHIISYAFPQKRLPDRWLLASVTEWNRPAH